MTDRKQDFADHFSAIAAKYANYRPSYPPALFDWLAEIVPGRDLAWDCACGNGQASRGLADRFKRVVATDASQAQIAATRAHPKIEYRVTRAEASGLADASADLVTVATALHWFDNDGFYNEARRVLKPGGILAAWTYPLLTLADEKIFARVRQFYDAVESYWPPERIHVLNDYKSLSFPFTAIETPKFRMEVNWNLAELMGYFRTWSSVQQFMKQNSRDPVTGLEYDLGRLWGDPESAKAVHWNLVLRAGKK